MNRAELQKLATLVLARHDSVTKGEQDDADADLDSFVFYKHDTLEILANSPPQLEGLPTVPGRHDYRSVAGCLYAFTIREIDGRFVADFSPDWAVDPIPVDNLTTGDWYGPIPEREDPEP